MRYVFLAAYAVLSAAHLYFSWIDDRKGRAWTKPFLLVLLQNGGNVDDITICAMLSFICCLGDLMPPTALAGNYAAQAVELKYAPVLKKCVVPFLVSLALAMLYLLNSGTMGFLTA